MQLPPDLRSPSTPAPTGTDTPSLAYAARFPGLDYGTFADRRVCTVGLGPCRERGQDDPRAVVQAVAQAARIAGAAHRKGWIHRDLKPSNLAIGPDGRVTVLDWGLVRPIQRDGQTQLAIAGTPGFMPPELLRGIVPAYTPDVDTFALGCTLAVLLSRSPVAVGALRPSLVRRILAEAGLTGIAASTLHHIICRAISISPAERWEDGDTLAAELEDWVSLMADAATEAPAPHATLARRSRTAS